MDYKKIENKMLKFAKNISSELPLKFDSETDNPFLPAGIHSTNNGITIYWKNVMDNLEYLKAKHDSLSFEDVAWSILVHEIGHYLDYLRTDFDYFNKHHNILWNFIIEGNKEGIKNNFKSYFQNLIKLEENAWSYASKILPKWVDLKNFETYKEFCLGTYYSSFKFEYRKFRLKSQISEIMNNFFDIHDGFTLNFDDYFLTEYDKEKKIFHLNVTNSCKRRRNFTNATSGATVHSVSILDKFLPFEDVPFPYEIKTFESLEEWYSESINKIEERMSELSPYFPIEHFFYKQYKKYKLSDLDFMYQLKKERFLKKESKEKSFA